MQVPLRISFENSEPSEAIRSKSSAADQGVGEISQPYYELPQRDGRSELDPIRGTTGR